MKINLKKYMIISKNRPIQFYDKCNSGEMTDDINDAMLFQSQAEVEYEFESFDDNSEFEILPVNIEFNF